MSSERSFSSGYESASPNPEHSNYGQIHHTNTAGLSLLLGKLFVWFVGGFWGDVTIFLMNCTFLRILLHENTISDSISH
jgi:hypothetical protein